jgi:biotin carboxylase
MKKLLIVGAGPMQVPAYRAGHAKGLHLVAIDKNPTAPGMGLADSAYVFDTRDIERAVAIARDERVDGALTLCADAHVRTVAAVCRALDLPGIAPEVALKATHRGHMRDAFAKSGVPIPRYRRTFDLDDARAAVMELGLPAMVKPVGAFGSQGVYRLNLIEDLEEAHAYALSASQGATEILVEELADGPEVSVETLSYKGQHHLIAITDKRTTGDPHWVELGHVEPSQLPRVAQTQVKVATLAGLDALGIADSAAHVEVRVTRKGPRIVEINARLGGDYSTTELLPRSTGVDIVASAIDVALGNVPRVRHTKYKAAAITYLAAQPGVVTAVHGLDEARQQPGVAVVELFVGPGETVRSVVSSQDQPGYVVAEADEPAAAEARAQAAAALIRIETKP